MYRLTSFELMSASLAYMEMDTRKNSDTKPIKSMHMINRCVFYSTCTMTAIMLFSLIALICTIGADANTLIADASKEIANIQETMRDVQDILPNVKRTLLIMEKLCQSDVFKQAYHITCGPT